MSCSVAGAGGGISVLGVLRQSLEGELRSDFELDESLLSPSSRCTSRLTSGCGGGLGLSVFCARHFPIADITVDSVVSGGRPILSFALMPSIAVYLDLESEI